MSKLIASMMTSLDGFIEGPNRELDWPLESPDFNAYCDDMLDHADTMIFGRVSYEMMVQSRGSLYERAVPLPSAPAAWT